MKRKSLFLFFILALGVKLVLFLILNQAKIAQFPEFIGEFSGDSNGYLNPVDQFFEKGIFYSSHRMPGYSLVYFIFSLFFHKDLSLNLLVLFQIVMSALSCMLLAHFGFLISHKNWVFIATFFFTLFSTYLTWYDGYILTESLTISVLVILVYVFSKYSIEKRNWAWMLFPGFLFAWLVFLRPIFFPLGLLFFLIFVKENTNLKSLTIQALSFFSPFLIFESFWIGANYQWHQRFIPFQESFLGPSQSNVFFEPPFRFIQSWGGNYLWWEPGAHIRYFGVSHDSLYYFDQDDIKFPPSIFTSRFNQDSLKKLRDELLFLKLDTGEISKSEFNNRSDLIYKKFDDYSRSIKKEKPKLYWIDSRIILVKQFLFLSKIRNPFYNIEFPLRQVFIDLKAYAYIITLFLGYLSSVTLLFFIRKNPSLILISGIVWYIFLIHPIVLRVVENRYLLPSYPFLILSIILAHYFVFNYLKLGKSLFNARHSPA